MQIKFGVKKVLIFTALTLLFCIVLGRAPSWGNDSTSTLQDTIRWITEQGSQYGTFQPRFGEDLPPVETRFAFTNDCKLQVTMNGGCGRGGLDSYIYRISLSKVRVSEPYPLSPAGPVDEYLLGLTSDDPDAFQVKKMNAANEPWRPSSEIRLCTRSGDQADQLRSHLNQAALLCAAKANP